MKKEMLRIVVAWIYTIDFQKRDLPHAHILITLAENDSVFTDVEINKIVCAEIPNAQTRPMLHNFVAKHMMQGPCCILNPHSIYMRDGK